jgi:hypothetical protein
MMRNLKMKPFRLLAASLLALTFAGSVAQAAAPAFTATCPTGITATSDGKGHAKINGKRATIKAVGDAWEVRGRGVTVSVGGDPLSADYTGPHRANGVCQISAGAAAPAAPAASSRMPSQNEQACLQAVSLKTNNGDVVLLGSETSEANDTVYVGVGQQRAKWKCLVKRGKVAEVSSMTNEGGL